ncbi:hypothetical protein Sste5346_002507 [Sporothrix stenoceras]|uniref:Uncharacterized protein n=1 Tax=Sporothrix stenoceras TaxID=5173 RepID=A0ABR3ZJ24_9PEZI
MNPIALSAAAAPLASRTAVRWYSQNSIVAAGGMMTRRGAAARSHGKRSPTVRRAQNTQINHLNSNRSTPPGAITPTSTSTKSLFPDDPSFLMIGFAEGLSTTRAEITVEKCLEVMQKAKLIEQNKASVNKATVLKDLDITPYQLHIVGLLILSHRDDPHQHSAPAVTMSMNLLHMAVIMGNYLPSALTIVSMFGVRPPHRTAEEWSARSHKMRKGNIYQDAEELFLDYLKKANASSTSTTGKDDSSSSQDALIIKANAYTLAGLLAETSGNKARALRWFQAAKNVGKDIGEPIPEGKDVELRPQKWDWERRCLELIGQLQPDEPDVVTEEEAREAFRTAVLALNSESVSMQLAIKYAHDSSRTEAQDREMTEIIQRASYQGDADASEVLAGREAIFGSALGISKYEAAFHDKLSDEWRQLAEVQRKLQ